MVFKWLRKKEKKNKKKCNNENSKSGSYKDEVLFEKNILELDVKDINSSEVNGFKKSILKKESLFARVRKNLFKTRKAISGEIESLFKGKSYIDDAILEGLEELLITSDIGVDATIELLAKIYKNKSSISNSNDLKLFLKKEILKYFNIETTVVDSKISPKIIMVIGVNGVGKTSTIGKLAYLESMKGNRVLIVAADTFRAAAVEQVSILAKRVDAYVVKHDRLKADPAAVAYDGVSAAVSRGFDTVFIDTAGRLHTKINLMEELKKISRSVAKKLPGAPHEVLLVLDSTTGQNSIKQAEKFNQALGVTSIILTKLDSSSKGGIVINICKKFNIPITHITLGESINDLQEFDSKNFIDAII